MAPGDRPLAGRGVLVTRPPGQGEELAAALERLGARVHRVPLIEVHAIENSDLYSMLHDQDLLRTHWVVFTSANAARIYLQLAGGGARFAEVVRAVRAEHPDRAMIAAIGAGTARILEEAGLTVDLIPAESHAEGLLAALLAAGVAGQRVLIPRAKIARELLPEGLRAAGCTVQIETVYETRTAGDSTEELRGLFEAHAIDAVTFTSSSTVEAFREMTPFPLPAGVVFAAIGPVTADTVRAHGLAPLVVAAESTAASLVEALVQRFSSP